MKKLLMIILLVLFFTSCNYDYTPGETRTENQYMKSIYLGKFGGTTGYVYKITIDSVDYIVVKSGDGLAITKVK